MNVHMGSGGEIAGKGLHQAKTIRSSSLQVLISTGVDLLSMFGCGLMIVTRVESDRGFSQHTFTCAFAKVSGNVETFRSCLKSVTLAYLGNWEESYAEPRVSIMAVLTGPECLDSLWDMVCASIFRSSLYPALSFSLPDCLKSSDLVRLQMPS